MLQGNPGPELQEVSEYSELKKEKTFLDKRTMASRAVPRLTPTKLAPLLIDQLQNNEFNLYKPIRH